MKIGEMPTLWLEQYLTEQKEQLKELVKNEQAWGHINGYQKLLSVRQEVVKLIEQ